MSVKIQIKVSTSQQIYQAMQSSAYIIHHEWTSSAKSSISSLHISHVSKSETILDSKFQAADFGFQFSLARFWGRFLERWLRIKDPGLSQILSKVFLSKNLLLELTKYFVSLLRDSVMIT